ncbi:MAG: hypothetical protein KKD17_01965 [Nanoarchaeota archaeon]|nr:hypothetical protein [Nanoarchaeota archaeon]
MERKEEQEDWQEVREERRSATPAVLRCYGNGPAEPRTINCLRLTPDCILLVMKPVSAHPNNRRGSGSTASKNHGCAAK